MNLFIITGIAGIVLAAVMIVFKIKKTKQLNTLLEERQYTKISSVSWLIIIHISLIGISIATMIIGFKEKNISMFISSTMIILLCLFELLNFTFDGTVYYSDDYTVIQNVKIKNKHIVRITTTGKFFKQGTVVTTNGANYQIGYKAASILKGYLKK